MPGSKRSPRRIVPSGTAPAQAATSRDEPAYRGLVESLRRRREALAALHAEHLAAQRTHELSAPEYVELFDRGPLPCFVLDAWGVIGQSNVAAAELLTCERSRLTNTPLTIFVRTTHRRLFLEHMRRCRESRSLVTSELTLRTRSGIEIPVELSSRMLASAGGDLAYQTFAIDLRERQRLAAERQRALEERQRLEHEQRLARAASEAKDRFLAMLSHELRTPLSPVVLATSAWKDDVSLSNPLRETLEMIHRNVTIEARLIDDLLDLTRIVQNKLVVESHPVDLHALATEVVDGLRAESDAAGVDVALALESGGSVVGDALRLRQVIWNLLRNALHCTPPGGSVRIETRGAPGARVQLAVRDTGIGFDAETHARMFEPFDQGTRPDRLGLGLGLGLAIARGLVEAQGGSIAAFSDGPGCGATLVVELPATHAPVAARRAEPAPVPARGRTGSLRLLLVEDHEDTCIALSYVLQHEGYQVEIAHSVGQALAAATATDVDVLVSDLGLPDGSGLDLMRTLKARKPLRGVALTGFGRDEDVAETRAAGFERHLTKPVDVPTLIAAIESLRAS
jgi:PAS domain S-box-containing protein